MCYVRYHFGVQAWESVAGILKPFQVVTVAVRSRMNVMIAKLKKRNAGGTLALRIDVGVYDVEKVHFIGFQTLVAFGGFAYELGAEGCQADAEIRSPGNVLLTNRFCFGLGVVEELAALAGIR
ncbi:MAG: hypothetical protein JO331_12960 [Verrucomicrobia bacterium]|nr:hypothetical protein [Verrucomicrobiota bacterium]